MKLFLALLFQCFIAMCFAQINYAFVKHLDEQKLFQEELYYLNSLDKHQVSQDSLNFLLAKFYLKQKKDSLFFTHYKLSYALFNKDQKALQYIDYYFLKHIHSKPQQVWFNELHPHRKDSSLELTGFYNTLTFFENSTFQLSNTLKSEISKYNVLSKKKPIVAGCLSAVIPGLGKLYGQRPNSAILTFFSHTLFAVQSIESIKKFGFKNGYSIFSVSLFGLFYMSNIYGSVTDLKKQKIQRKKQILINAEKYFNLNYPASLY
jgi:hypothetical protein